MGFLPDYEGLRPVQGMDISVWRTEALDVPSTPAVVAILGARWAERNETANADLALYCEDLLERECYDALLARYPAPVIVIREEDIDVYLRVRDPVYVLVVAVTEADPGIGVVRYVVGYYAGAAKMQAEFALRDARTNRLMATFATRRAHAGDSYGGLNPRSMSAEYTLKKLTPGIARDAVAVMADILAGKEIVFQEPADEQ